MIDAASTCWRRRPGRQRKPIPVPPRCRNCDQPIPRRRYGYGLEAHCNYLRRKFCNQLCTLAWFDRSAPDRKPSDRLESFDDFVLGHIGRVTPKQPAELHNEIVNDWGEVTVRTIYRSLARLRLARRVVQTGEGYVRAQERRAA